MKRFTLLFVLALGLLTVQAQTKFGIKGGLNIANVGGSDVEDNKAKLGFFLGGFADIPVVEKFSVQPELLFSAQGYGVERPGDDIKINQGFILLPVMAKYSFGSVFAETGPQLGFLLSAKAKQDGDKDNVKDAYKKTTFSWNVGVGYQPPASNFGANLRFNLGLSRIDEDGDAKAFYRVFQLGVFYVLGTGK